MSSLFSSSSTTKSNSENNSQSNTQGNLTSNPQYQQFLEGYGNLANNSISNITTPTNQYGEQAGSDQSGVASNLTPGYSAASNAASGTTYNSTSYKPYMSEYTSAVTDALQRQYGNTMKQVAETTRGNLASQGALGNSNNAVAVANALTPIANAENTALTNVQQQGFNTANQNAQTAGNFQLSGANSLGSLTNANTSANSALSNIGQNLYNNQITSQKLPAEISNLYNQGWSTANTISGYNTQGKSTGNSASTTESTPSLFSSILGTIGTLSGLGAKDGGAIPPYYADGGAVIDLDPVLLAHLIKGMPPAFVGKFAEGGNVQDEPIFGVAPWLTQQIEDAKADRGAWDTRNKTNDVSALLTLPGEAARIAAEVTMIPQAFRTKDAIAKAYHEPSISTLTNAGINSAFMALPFNPMAAAKTALGTLGAGYGAATAKELLPSLMPTSAHAQDRFDPVKEALSDKEIADYQRRKRQVANGDKDAAPILADYNARIAKAYDAHNARINREAEIRATSKAASEKDAADALRASNERADAARKDILAKASAAYEAEMAKERRFANTEWGKLYDETGGAAPFLLSAAGGGLGGLARHPAWAALGEGALLGLAGTSLPFLTDYVNSPALNPKRQGMIAYNEIAPADDPRRQRYEELMKNEKDYPTNNPVPEIALDKLFDPRRIGLSLAEGAGMGLSGWAVPKATPYAAEGVEATMRRVGNVAKDAVVGTAETLGSIPGTISASYHKGMGRAATAKEAAAELQQNAASKSRLAADESRSATAARSDALAARDELAEALRRSNGRVAATDQPASPLPSPRSASDRNSTSASMPPTLAVDKTPPFDAGQGERIENYVKDLHAAIAKQNAERATKAAEIAAPVKREALPAPDKAPSYSTKYKSIAQPFIAGRVAEGRDIPTTSEVMGQFDKAGMKQPSFAKLDERVADNAPRLLGLIYANNPGITPTEAARKLTGYMANPKSIPSEWGLPKEFILPAVTAPIAASAIYNRDDRADGGSVSPETHEIPEGHAWEHRGVGSKLRGPDGSFVPMGIAQRKNGGVTTNPVRYKRTYATGGVVVGPIVGTTGGRTDAKPVSVPANAYVIPADIVSAIPGAEGNTLAGMRKLDQIFAHRKSGYAAGGASHKPVPILISDGEYVVPPDIVAMQGGGDVRQGHRILDAFVKKLRSLNIKKLKSLPAPAQ